jgi:hypothetical protein
MRRGFLLSPGATGRGAETPAESASHPINARYKLSPDEAREIISCPLGCRATAALFNVSHSQVSKIRRGLSWAHLSKFCNGPA